MEEVTQPTIPTQDEPKQAKVDFLPLFAGGLSHDKISEDSRQNNYSLTLLPEDQAYEKYSQKGNILEGLPKDKFHDLYTKAHDSYDYYQTTRYNKDIAPYWQHSTPDTSDAVSSGLTDIMPAGVDKYGRQIATPEEVAEKRGYAIDTDGKQIPYKPPTFLKKMWDVPTSMFFTAIVPELAPLLQGDDPNKVMILDHDQTGTPVYKMVAADDPKVLRSQVASAWGAPSMQENWFAAMLKGFYNGVIGIESMVGTALEETGRAVDFVSSGKDPNNWLERRGRVFQNLAQRSKAPVSQEAQGGFFSSFSSASYSIGSLIPVVLLTRGAGGLGEGALKGMGVASDIAETTAHGASTFAIFSGLGMDAYNEAGKENGLDPADLGWQVPLAGLAIGAIGLVAGPTFLTKGLATAELKAQGVKMISTQFKEVAAKYGVSFAELPAEVKLRTIRDLQVPLGKLFLGAHGMGAMMAGQDIPMVGVQTLNDLRALAHNPNAAPGKGQFEKYDTNKNFLSNVMDRLPSKMLSSYINGFFSGLLYTPVEAGLRKGAEVIRGKPFDSPGLFSKMKDMTNENLVATGKVDDMIRLMTKEKDKHNIFGRTTHDNDGNVIPEGSDAMTENDARFNAWRDDLLLTRQNAMTYADPSVQQAFGNNIGLFRDLIVSQKELEKVNQSLADETLDPTKRDELSAQADGYKQRIEDITKKEEGTQFSKAYNDLIKSNSISQISVYDATDKEWKNSHSDKDFTPDVRKTPEWKASLEKNLKNDNLRRSYEASKVFSTEVDKEIDRRKKANTQLATEEITLQPAVDQLREQVKDIIKLPDELKRIEGAQRVVGMIKSVATKIDLSRQKDLKNEFLTLQGTLYKTPAEFNQAFDLNEDLFTNRQNLLSTDRDHVINDLLSNDILQEVNGSQPTSVASMMKPDSYDFDAARRTIKSLQDKVENNKRIIQSGWVLGNDRTLKPHITKSDLVLNDEQANAHNDWLNITDGKLRAYEASNNERLNNTNDQYFVQHIDKGLRDLHEVIPAVLHAIPDFGNAVNAIPVIPDYLKDPDHTLTDGEQKKLNEVNKQITDLKSQIFDNRDKIVGSPDFDTWITDVVQHARLTGVQDGYLNRMFYDGKTIHTSLDALSQLTSEDDLLVKKGDVDLGYISAINFLIESLGVQSRSIEVARLKSMAAGNEVSSPAMQQAENLAFAFMMNSDGNAHNVLNKVVEAESKYLTDWKGKGIQKEVDEYKKQFVENSIFIGGDSGTGKSTKFLKGLFDLIRYSGDPKEFNKQVVSLSVSKGNDRILSEGLKDTNAEYLNLEDILRDASLTEKVKNTDYIVLDEAQRLKESDIALVRSYFINGTILLLGDTRQGSDLIAKTSVKTLPFTERKNNANPLVNVLHDLFRGIGTALPNGFVNESGDGLRYYRTKEDVVKGFYADNTADKALLLSDADFEMLTEEEKKNPKIFTLDRDIQNLDADNPIRSIRGSIFKKVYIGFDRNGNDADYYTATGRATGFIGLPDKRADELNKTVKEQTPWVDLPATISNELANTFRGREEARLRAVTGDQTTVVKPIEPEKVKSEHDKIYQVHATPKKDDIFKTTGKQKGFVKIVDAKEGESFVTVVRGESEEYLRGLGMGIQIKIDKNELSYLDGTHQNLYEPKPQTPNPIGKTSSYDETGESWAYLHNTFGTDVSPEDHATKQGIVRTLHSLSNFFIPELTYHSSQDMTDETGKTVTKNDVLAVRFTLNPTIDKAEFLYNLKRAKGITDKVYGEIAESVNSTGELPDKYRYLMTLDQPNDKLSEGHNNDLQQLIKRGQDQNTKEPFVLAQNLRFGKYGVYAVKEKTADGESDKFIPLKELIAKVQGKVELGKTLRTDDVTVKGQQKLSLKYDPLKVTSGSHYITVRTPSLEESAGEGKAATDVLSTWKGEDAYLRNKSDIENTRLWNFIHNNRQQYLNKIDKRGKDLKTYRSILDKYGDWAYGKTKKEGLRYSLKDSSKDSYNALYDELIKHADSFKQLEEPFYEEYSLDDAISSDYFLTNTLDLVPHATVSLKGIEGLGEKAVTPEPTAPSNNIQQFIDLAEKIRQSAEPTTKFWHEDTNLPENLKDQAKVGNPITEEQFNQIPQKPIDTATEFPDIPAEFIADAKVIGVDKNYFKDSDVIDHRQFSEGGNDEAYPNFTPKNTLLVDYTQDAIGQAGTIVHEGVERQLMQRGLMYNDAHNLAAEVEALYRDGKVDEAKAKFQEEINKNTKQDIIPDEEYTAFVDKNDVSPERLQSLADKIKAGTEKLSDREIAILQARTADIENILREEEVAKGTIPETDVLDSASKLLLKNAIDKLNLSQSQVDDAIRKAGVIATADKSESIKVEHIAEAIGYVRESWYATSRDIDTAVRRQQGSAQIQRLQELGFSTPEIDEVQSKLIQIADNAKDIAGIKPQHKSLLNAFIQRMISDTFDELSPKDKLNVLDELISLTKSAIKDKTEDFAQNLYDAMDRLHPELRTETSALTSWMDNNLNPNKDEGIKTKLSGVGVNLLNIDGKTAFEKLNDGTIDLEVQKDGINSHTPKYDLFHLVYNYFLDEPSKKLVMNDVKTAMKRFDETWRGKKITDLQAKEYLVNHIKDTDDKPWVSPKGILGAFMGVVTELYDKYSGNQPLVASKELFTEPHGLDIVSGFYSPIEKGLLDIKQEKMTANQWLTQLKGRGVKADELTYTGLEELLKANPSKSFTKGELQNWMKDNRIEIKEVVLGGEKTGEFTQDKQERLDDLERRSNDLTDAEYTEYQSLIDLENKTSDENGVVDQTKFGQYQLAGDKENYKEVLITLPNKSAYKVVPHPELKDRLAILLPNGEYKRNGPESSAPGTITSWENEKYADQGMRTYAKDQFRSSHFDEPNILAHLRMNTRVDNEGKKTLFIEEIQGDFPQAYRKGRNSLIDAVDKNPDDIIEAFKKNGKLRVIC